MATVNYKNSNILSITTDTTLPTYITKTGTLSVTANTKEITGVGTLFTTETKVGDWIIDLTNHEMRKITAIGTNLACTVDNNFSNTLSGATVKIIPSSRVVSILFNCASGSAVIEGITIPVATTIVWDKSSRETQHSPIDFVDPVFINGTSGTVTAWYQL